MNYSAEFVDRVLALSDREDACACGEQRSPLSLTLANKPIKCFGCRWCDVRLSSIIEGDELYAAILRHPSDPAYDWLPENMRAACASGGFGHSISSENPLGRRYPVINSWLWITDNHVCLKTEIPAFDAAEWRAKLPAETNHATAERGIKSFLASRHHKEVVPVGLDNKYFSIGDAYIDATYLKMIQALYPEARAFVGRVDGMGNTDPLIFRVGPIPVALCMPVWLG